MSHKALKKNGHQLNLYFDTLVLLTMNDFDICEGDVVSFPHSAYLHPTHVPPRVLLLQVVHGHSEDLLDRVVEDAHPLLLWVDRASVVGSSQRGAELSCAPLTPVFHIAGVLRLVVAWDCEGASLQD